MVLIILELGINPTLPISVIEEKFSLDIDVGNIPTYYGAICQGQASESPMEAD